MKKNKLLSLIVLIMGIIIFFLYKNNIQTNIKLNIAQDKLNTINKMIIKKNLYESKAIWEVSSIDKKRFLNFINEKINSKYFFVIKIDSLNCIKCLNFHESKLNNINLNRIIISRNLSSFFQRKEYKYFPYNYKKDRFSDEKFLILLLNREGVILYSDPADLKIYKFSNSFYEKARHLLGENELYK